MEEDDLKKVEDVCNICVSVSSLFWLPDLMMTEKERGVAADAFKKRLNGYVLHLLLQYGREIKNV